ncbi:MAG: carbohydrate kinase [Chloroflexales bacterium]|nr:carbohydrate kinase [Chloroflexales bacterium]
MAAVLLLGIDVGSTNCKAIVFDQYGQPVSVASLPTPTLHPCPGWAEYDPDALWQTVVRVIRQACAAVDPRQIQGVAVASMGEAGAPLDAQGRPTYQSIAWYDSRTTPQDRWWREQFVNDVIFSISGLSPLPIYGINKLMWLRDNQPEAYAKTATWLHIADYIAFKLCGVPATDYSLGSRTMVMDLVRRRWSLPLLERAGIRADLWPELMPSGVKLGEVSAAAATETGLAAGTCVGVGGHDHVCGAFAVGVSAGDVCLDSIGTAEAVFCTLEQLQLDERVRRTGCALGAHVARDKYYILDGLWTAGASIEWAKNLFAWPGDQGDRYAAMEAAAANAATGSMGVFFLPRLAAGERGGFVGLIGDADAGVMARAIYEGLAYEWRSCFESMVQPLALPIETIKVIGGGARCRLWLQIKANVLNRPLLVLDVAESVALGAALLAGIASGVYRDEAEAQQAVRHVEHLVTPDPARAAQYDRWYRNAYLHVAPALGALSQRIEQAIEG